MVGRTRPWIAHRNVILVNIVVNSKENRYWYRLWSIINVKKTHSVIMSVGRRQFITKYPGLRDTRHCIVTAE